MVVNHMVGAGGTGTGSAGSYYDADSLEFPAVPYGPNDFNCCFCSDCSSSNCGVNDYNNPAEVCTMSYVVHCMEFFPVLI